MSVLNYQLIGEYNVTIHFKGIFVQGLCWYMFQT